ncbi:unnamed protein product [Rangifer tarandus platyrhynchus]|uniref:tRNA pseudouridine(55) synthase n=1 Tax=Rangifer tarandus platyrhynchus TaxID=3082113 RepID=A0ABN8XIW2_RANTA|nr:unnamed protein product [Rangifer tarandus platyrhynchus]
MKVQQEARPPVRPPAQGHAQSDERDKEAAGKRIRKGVAGTAAEELRTAAEEFRGAAETGERLLLFQKTPLRVLHRRSLAERCDSVESLGGRPVFQHRTNAGMCGPPQTSSGGLMCMKGVTSLRPVTGYASLLSGTYIKEFVHGDYGRTKPSLSSLLHSRCRVLLLDVVDLIVAGVPLDSSCARLRRGDGEGGHTSGEDKGVAVRSNSDRITDKIAVSAEKSLFLTILVNYCGHPPDVLYLHCPLPLTLGIALRCVPSSELLEGKPVLYRTRFQRTAREMSSRLSPSLDHLAFVVMQRLACPKSLLSTAASTRGRFTAGLVACHGVPAGGDAVQVYALPETVPPREREIIYSDTCADPYPDDRKRTTELSPRLLPAAAAADQRNQRKVHGNIWNGRGPSAKGEVSEGFCKRTRNSTTPACDQSNFQTVPSSLYCRRIERGLLGQKRLIARRQVKCERQSTSIAHIVTSVGSRMDGPVRCAVRPDACRLLPSSYPKMQSGTPRHLTHPLLKRFTEVQH